MKKWFTFLLLLVTTTATLYPCCSEYDCQGEELTTSTSDDSKQKSGSNCSPFITCGTCTGFVQSYKIADVPVIAKEKPVHHSKVISLTLSTYTASLLQPPRLA
jgi:hypothetical protein